MTERQTLSGIHRSHLPCEKERLRRIASAAFEPQPAERPSGNAYRPDQRTAQLKCENPIEQPA